MERERGGTEPEAPKDPKKSSLPGFDMASPPPPPPPLQQFPAPSKVSSQRSPPSSSSSPFNPSLFITTAILALVIVASAAIHLLLRFLSRSSSSSSSSSAPPLIHQSHSSSASAASSALSDQEKAALIESLPLFSLASSLAVFPKASPDCAVCLSPFQPHDELRLLPACGHAFHSPCIDTWLRSTPSCPLCRSSITLPAPPLPPMPPAGDAADNPPRSSSFRIEIGSVSRRRTSTDLDPAGAGTSLPNPPPPPPPPQHLRSYSLGSSFEYVVDEEVEAVVARIRRAKEDKAQPPGPAPPGEEVAEAAGGGGRNWLKEYVDRLTSSASSSFSSLRFSERWSHRYDDDGGGGGGGGGGRDSWDLEGNYQDGEGEESGYYTFYRWLVGI